MIVQLELMNGDEFRVNLMSSYKNQTTQRAHCESPIPYLNFQLYAFSTFDFLKPPFQNSQTSF